MAYSKGSRPNVPVIYNVTMTVADTEYSQALPLSCLTFLIHTRDESEFRLAFETGRVATPTNPYLTVLANCRYFEPKIENEDEDITIYFASDSAGKIVEIIAWT